MAKKTYNEKLNSPGELPKIEDLSEKPESIKRFGGTKTASPHLTGVAMKEKICYHINHDGKTKYKSFNY
jgi:hypothetical protein